MSGTDPTLWSATEQAAAIAGGRLGSEELLDCCLARIDAVDPQVHAVCTMAVDQARVQARAADAATARGESWGPLHGVPFTVKDAIETAGIRSTGGSPSMGDHVPTRDAPAVAAIKAAGGVLFGKTNLPEWSGDWQSFNAMFGTTNNPWDLGRTAGGSSGGAAAAVACGMTGFEIGTDIGGSVRVPAAFCGVFGHKPSFGVVPTLGYLDEPGGGLTEGDVNTFGPLARDAADLGLLLDLMAAARPDHSAVRPSLVPHDPDRVVAGLRVAAWFDEPELETDGESVAVLHRAADALLAGGALVDRSARPRIDVAGAWRAGARLVGAAVSVSDDVDPGLSHREWLFMDRDRARTRRLWAEFFEQFDVLLCPVTLVPAFPHLQEGRWDTRLITVNGRERRYLDLEGWPALIGAAYLPSTATPVGFTSDGLPVGVQVVAPFLHDHRAIAVAGALAMATGGYRPPPLLGSTSSES